MTQNKENSRIAWIDIAKGMGIILVGIGHTYMPKEICVWINSFHMPLFFILSGMTYKVNKYSIKIFAWRKFKALMIPYFIFCTLEILSGILMGFVYHSQYNIFDAIKCVLTQLGHKPVWFLVCLFITENICNIIYTFFVREDNDKTIIMVISGAIALVNNFTIKVTGWIWDIDIVPTALFMFILGNIIYEKKEKLKEMVNSVRFIICTLILNVSSAVVNYHVFDSQVGMEQNAYGNYVVFIIGAVSGSLLIIGISVRIERTLMKDVAGYVGKNSLLFYGLHTMIYPFVDKILSMTLFYRMNSVMTCIDAICVVIITLIIVNIIAIFWNKTIRIILYK